jgi:hypothetical protein
MGGIKALKFQETILNKHDCGGKTVTDRHCFDGALC